MNNLTESDIRYLRDCVLSSTLLGHEVKKGSEVLRKLDQALSIANVEGQGEQLKPLPPNECKQCGVLIDYRLKECGDCGL